MHNTVVHGLGSSTSNNPQEAKGHDLKAADFYQKGIEIAHSATTTEEHLKSIELFSVAIAIRPNQPRFFFARGSSFRSINEFENAAKDFSTAISLDDRCALYYANRGACYRKVIAEHFAQRKTFLMRVYVFFYVKDELAHSIS
jgi:tetratricopeptide (TPR) repeat protein